MSDLCTLRVAISLVIVLLLCSPALVLLCSNRTEFLRLQGSQRQGQRTKEWFHVPRKIQVFINAKAAPRIFYSTNQITIE